MRAVFLYTELAGYFLAAVKHCLQQGHTLLIYHWPVNKEAPFDWEGLEGVELINRSGKSVSEIKERVLQFNPDVLVTSGWMDKGYVAVAKSLRKTCKTVISLDNHWKGTLKQYLAIGVSPFFIKRIYDYIWVPGSKQVTYAQKLGFREKQIKTGFYVADVPLFESYYQHSQSSKTRSFPKRFLYLGRYVEHKGIKDLFAAFLQLQQQTEEWELWCAGTGDLFPQRLQHPKVKHLGFVQPEQMQDVISQTGVYTLPSHEEPWGVSVQEMAVAGFPMILAEPVASAEKFLAAGENGIQVKAGDVNGLAKAMFDMTQKSEEELMEMSKKSRELGLSLSQEDWEKTLVSFAD